MEILLTVCYKINVDIIFGRNFIRELAKSFKLKLDRARNLLALGNLKGTFTDWKFTTVTWGISRKRMEINRLVKEHFSTMLIAVFYDFSQL